MRAEVPPRVRRRAFTAFAALLLASVVPSGLARATATDGYTYADLSAAEAEALLEETFSAQLAAIDADPSRALSEVSLVKVASPTEALVTVDGELQLLESAVPIRAADGEGEVRKVDLALEEAEAGGFVPANPLVDLELPEAADEPIAIGDDGVALTAEEGSAASTASLSGEESLFFSEAQNDTSLMLAPVSGGLELSAQLLSRDSPEQIPFHVTMPAGATLRPTTGGGAEVLSASGETLAGVTAPQAVDAQGSSVPVSLAVEEGSLAIEVPHREMDVTYPIFVDPEIVEDWTGFADTSKLNYWNWQWGGVGAEDFIGMRGCIPNATCWGNGLYVRSRSNFTYPGGSYGRWWFVPQGTTTFMRRVILGPMNYDAHGCTANEPHPYVGVWNDYSGWKVLSNAYPSGWGSYLDTGGQNLGAGTRTAFVGIEAAGGVNLKCGHDYRLGGATLYLDDPENPAINWVSGLPTKWLKDNSPVGVGVNVSDPGLGVSSSAFSPAGAPPLAEKSVGCNGHFNSQCPGNYTFQWSVGADSFDQGEKGVRFSAFDALGKSTTYDWTMKVDRTPPEVELAGQLARATDETEGDGEDETGFDKLSLPVYNLTVNTTDGSSASAATKRSGVKSIEVFLDGKGTPEQTWTQPGAPSSCDSCPLNVVYTLKLNELGADVHHTLRVVVKDYASNTPRERNIEFEFIPATGISDEYLMQHFPLPNGQGNEEEEENPVRPELAVNLVNGNLVYHQLDVEVPGAAADLEVERFYNSLLPNAQNSEFGDGWTLAQTPTLEIEEPGAPGPPEEATVVQESGAVESKVELPTANGEEVFDEGLGAVVTKEAGGYALSEEGGESASATVFNEAGEATEERASEYTSVEIEREGGVLSEIAVDDPASTDLLPDEVKEPVDPPTFQSAFGTLGTAGGQLKRPGDVALDAAGNLWVLEKTNNRIQKFDENGQFILAFGKEVNKTKTEAGAPEAERNICTAASGNVCQAGKSGSANGQFNSPSALAVSPNGEIWVADTLNNRVQEFSAAGEFIRKAGTVGTGNGQLREPYGVAVDSKGNVWVADTTNKRIQEFGPTGEFLKVIGAGELGNVFQIAIAPSGDLFLTESARVKAYSPTGTLLRQFGEAGSGSGQFSTAGGIEVDSKGEVWVTDTVGDRIVGFDEAGDPIATFGALGSGSGQLNLTRPAGLIASAQGELWIADAENNRVQRWQAFGYHQTAKELAPQADDPSLEVETSSGLVESIEGEEAGEVSYDHSGDLLTAADGPEGETTYQYDASKRLTKVTLPNGTWGEVTYEPTYGRVKSVTVSIEGKASKTTQFEYTDAPSRSTKVIPAGESAVTYDIGDDGSVLRWQNAKEPPVIDDVGGKLHDIEARETATPIAPGAYNLTVQAHAPEGITSIQVIANGNVMVQEKNCEKEKPWLECTTEKTEWVTETAALTPGILYLEVIATDRLGQSTGEKFWVNVPYTPPPDPEAEAPPRFSDIKRFREEFGLDLDLKGNEEGIDDRVFDLMGDWNNPNTPGGEVARATAERWGVPLRSIDAAEIEYREWYMEVDGQLIEDWGYSHYPSSYAGYEVDHAAGGIVRIGFTEGQEARVTEFLQTAHPLGADRIVAFKYVPDKPLASLEKLDSEVEAALNSDPVLMAAVAGIELHTAGNMIRVEAVNIGIAESRLLQLFGSLTNFSFVSVPSFGELLTARDRQGGRMLGGDRIWTDWTPSESPLFTWGTAGFGAFEKDWIEQEKRWIFTPFLIEAGHMGSTGAFMYREANPNATPQVKRENGEKVGRIGRNAYLEAAGALDALAMRFNAGDLAPRRIFGNGPTGPERPAWNGEPVCTNGARTEHRECGRVVGFRQAHYEEHSQHTIGVIVVKGMKVNKGDSGAPVWNPRTRASVGLVSYKPSPNGRITYVQPLATSPYGHNAQVVGALDSSVMGAGSLHIMQGN